MRAKQYHTTPFGFVNARFVDLYNEECHDLKA
jgi:hypothetical protein